MRTEGQIRWDLRGNGSRLAKRLRAMKGHDQVHISGFASGTSQQKEPMTAKNGGIPVAASI